MVRKGEYLERAVVVPNGELTLDGLYHRGRARPAVLLVPPHPDDGSMELALIAEVAWAVTRAGHPTLRFNYPGVGASPGRFDAESAERAVTAAAAHLGLCAADGQESSPDAPCGLAIGWGARVAAKATGSIGFDRLILVQPDVEAWPLLERYEGRVVAIFAEADAVDERKVASAAAQACKDARIVVVKGADSGFRAGLVDLGRAVAETL